MTMYKLSTVYRRSTADKLSTALTRFRPRSRDNRSGVPIDPDNGSAGASAPARPEPEMKSPEFQRRAARAMGQSPVAWSG